MERKMELEKKVREEAQKRDAREETSRERCLRKDLREIP